MKIEFSLRSEMQSEPEFTGTLIALGILSIRHDINVADENVALDIATRIGSISTGFSCASGLLPRGMEHLTLTGGLGHQSYTLRLVFPYSGGKTVAARLKEAEELIAAQFPSTRTK